MPEFNGTGPRGKGPMTGGGRGYCVVDLSTRKQELGFLKNQARVLKEQLQQTEARIRALEAPRAMVAGLPVVEYSRDGLLARLKPCGNR